MIDFSQYHNLMGRILPTIIAWYRENKIDLPWRNEPTPYHVWISEIMLQQTRIDAVLSYYDRFLKALPTLKALASVDDDYLMKLWQGLGYYSRARNLKKSAVTVMEKYGGELPSSAAELEKLPGIGAYTAGAIASIAYGKPSPAVDGNVLRVISRMVASYEDIMQPWVKREVTRLLAAHYPEGEEAGLLTEGLMELGERVCIPNGAPRCERCPVRELCLAHRQGVADELPIRIVKTDKRIEEKTVFLIRSREGRYAISKRSEGGLLANMWELVNLDGFVETDDIENYLVRKGIRALAIEALPDAKHIFTHVIWRMKGFLVTVDKEADAFVFKTRSEILSDYAIPTAFRTYVNLMKE